MEPQSKSKANLKRIGKIISNVLIVAMIVCIVGLAVSKLCGIQFRAVLTPSMEPELPVGSLLVIVPTDFEDIQIGDDISFVRDKNLTVVTHRVIEKDLENKNLTTQGISNNAADKPTMYENVIGVVRYHIPALGRIVIWLDTTLGKIIAFAAIGALVLISFLFDSSDKKKDEVNPISELQ